MKIPTFPTKQQLARESLFHKIERATEQSATIFTGDECLMIHNIIAEYDNSMLEKELAK